MTPDEKIDAFEVLIDEASKAIATMAKTLKAGHATQDEIAAAMAEMAGALQSRKELPLADLLAAVKGIRITAPAVTINVSPTPIQNLVQPAQVHFLPAPESSGATWEIRIPGRYNGPDQVMTVKKIT